MGEFQESTAGKRCSPPSWLVARVLIFWTRGEAGWIVGMGLRDGLHRVERGFRGGSLFSRVICKHRLDMIKLVHL